MGEKSGNWARNVGHNYDLGFDGPGRDDDHMPKVNEFEGTATLLSRDHNVDLPDIFKRKHIACPDISLHVIYFTLLFTL